MYPTVLHKLALTIFTSALFVWQVFAMLQKQEGGQEVDKKEAGRFIGALNGVHKAGDANTTEVIDEMMKSSGERQHHEFRR